MYLKTLTKDQIKDLYDNHLTIDFPPSELKPLSVILEAVDKKIYESLALYDDEEMVGYTCLVRQESDYLVDYLAIYPEKRSSGYGSILLKLLSEYVGDDKNAIIEVEDPIYARDEDDRNTRLRRLDFYFRNGCCDTGIRVKCFGVEFIVLKIGSAVLEKTRCWDMYSSFYRAVLPKSMYDDNIELMGLTD